LRKIGRFKSISKILYNLQKAMRWLNYAGRDNFSNSNMNCSVRSSNGMLREIETTGRVSSSIRVPTKIKDKLS
jgi:hypothetical protein